MARSVQHMGLFGVGVFKMLQLSVNAGIQGSVGVYSLGSPGLMGSSELLMNPAIPMTMNRVSSCFY